VDDPEKLGDKVFKLRGKLDEEIGFRLAGRLFGRCARGHQPIVQVGVTVFQDIDKAAVETDQAVAAIKVLEPQIKSERWTFSHQFDALNGWKCAQRRRACQARNREFAARSSAFIAGA
jgi:hypothetical protein